MDPPTPISPSDPSYSLKHFIRTLITKIEVLADIQDLLSGTYVPTPSQPGVQPADNMSLRRHLEAHGFYFHDMLFLFEELVQDVQAANQSLLNGIIAFGRWELPDSMLGEDDVRECAERLYSLAQEAIDIDDQIIYDLRGMRIRLAEIVTEAMQVLKHVDDNSNLKGTDDTKEEVQMMMSRLHWR